jgi:p-hydroxybenzoate 3-monooxygenase
VLKWSTYSHSTAAIRSFVAEPVRWGRLVLAGDAAHTVPPTGAKGLNLAINDVRILAECLADALGPGGGPDALDAYSPRVLDRIWKSENFSYWMTQMLDTPPDGVSFDLKRQIGELNAVVSSPRPGRPTSPSPTPGGRAGNSPDRRTRRLLSGCASDGETG